MWNSYFFQLQKKYNMRVSMKKPLVIRFDGKNVTKNKFVDLMDFYTGGFFDSLEKTAEYFSKKYNCYSIFGSDEISFVIPDVECLIEDLEPSGKTTHSNELIAMLAQYFFDYFNHFDTHQKIFWHGKCFSIPEGKVRAYVKYRSGIIKNVMVTYFLKKNNKNNSELKLKDKANDCKALPEYEEFRRIQEGALYFSGKKLDLHEFLQGNVTEIKTEEEEMLIKKNEDIEVDINL